MRMTVCLLLGLSLGVAGEAWGQSAALDAGGSGWKFSGDAAAGKLLGREAVRMRTGRADRPEISLKDGTIEFDMAVTRHRSFVFLRFRIEDQRHYEEIYFRPHKSGLPDAVQYSPVDQVSNWQLYHGPGATAAVDLPPDQWIHVRLVVSGRRAALFVGSVEQPTLVVALAREPRAGGVGFSGFLPSNVTAESATANFANLVVRPGEVPEDVSFDLAVEQAPGGTVREWEVSGTFAPAAGPLEELPRDVVEGRWRRLATDSNGLLALNRHVQRPEGVNRPAVLARLRIASAGYGIRRLNLGYSDEVTVFVNGRPLFYADDSYSYDAPRRQGLIGLHQATLFLPLHDGENEVVLAVADSFGGWGLIGQLGR